MNFSVGHEVDVDCGTVSNCADDVAVDLRTQTQSTYVTRQRCWNVEIYT